MATRKKTKKKAAREPLSRERALATAMALADAEGLDGLSMRRLAEALGVEAMSLYHHVPNKDAILDGMVDLVFTQIQPPRAELGWRAALRERTRSVREVLVRHPWALRILESRRTPGHATLAHHDAVLGCLRGAGFSIALTAHAYALLDSYVFGFVHTEITLPFQTSEETQAVVQDMFASFPAGAYPHLAELTLQHVLKPGYAYANEFDWGLDLLLDGLERALSATGAGAEPRGASR